MVDYNLSNLLREAAPTYLKAGAIVLGLLAGAKIVSGLINIIEDIRRYDANVDDLVSPRITFRSLEERTEAATMDYLQTGV